ncbi:hypothetical protein [Alistipes indistinctus]|uniref:hypothetical protein n=1 Tax=Alistipes indistinctus TaxID=626932 RepID=UPI003522193A
MKKIVLALSAILVLVSCAQTKQWTDKERTEVKEVVRAHKRENHAQAHGRQQFC